MHIRRKMERNVIGIIGGMGPKAGVVLQECILEATPALTDQEHLSVITFTNTLIPDRTAAILADDTGPVEDAIVETGEALIRAGADILVMPCHTAHALYHKVSPRLEKELLDMVGLTINSTSPMAKVGLLATSGTRTVGVYPNHAQAGDREWIFPTESEQAELMTAIYSGIKAGEEVRSAEVINNLAARLIERGAEKVILGCTELSIVAPRLTLPSEQIVDPLRLVAHELTRRRWKGALVTDEDTIVLPIEALDSGT